MGEFIIPALIAIVMLLKKLFFFKLEPQYSASVVGKLELAGFFALFIVGTIAFIRKFSFARPKKFDPLTFFLLAATVITVGMSLHLNLNKTSMHWDAIALYDARAKFLEGGMKFSDMPTLAKYDNLNKYYYLLYPPYTSIGHFFWRSTGFLSQIPVGVYYSILFAALIIITFLVAKKSIGSRAASLLALLVASNNSIINISVKEYTNLPYTLHLIIGIFLLFSYIKTKKAWQLLYGVFFVSTSVWIRFLEPIWLVVILAFVIATFSKKDLPKTLLSSVVLGLFGLIQYLSWTYFTKVIGGNPGFLNLSSVSVFEPFLGVFTGSWAPVLIVFAKSWGTPLLIYLFALAAIGFRWRYVRQNREILFLSLIIIFSISLYFLQLYFVSFQASWWEAAARSLDRSSTFLIPVSGYLLIRLITSSQVLTTKDYPNKWKILQ